jgi:hypothetical protein
LSSRLVDLHCRLWVQLPQVVGEIGSCAGRTRHFAAGVGTTLHTAPSEPLDTARQLEVLPHVAGVLERGVEIIGDGGGRGIGEIYDRHGDEM